MRLDCAQKYGSPSRRGLASRRAEAHDVNVRIRRLRAVDLDCLLELFGSVAAERVHIATEPGFDKTRYRERWQATIDSKSEPCFVAVDGKRIIGELSIFENLAHGPTLGMIVDADYRRRGIGRKLMRTALNWARRHGVSKLSLRVFPHNCAAIALYESTGFRIIEHLKRDVPRANGEMWDSILMQADLELADEF